MPSVGGTAATDGTAPATMTALAGALLLLTPLGSSPAVLAGSASPAVLNLTAAGPGAQNANNACAPLTFGAAGVSVWSAREAGTATLNLTAAGGDSGPQPPNLPLYGNAPAGLLLTPARADTLVLREGAFAPLTLSATGSSLFTPYTPPPRMWYYTRARAAFLLRGGGTDRAAFTTNQPAPLTLIGPGGDALQLPTNAASASLSLAATGTSSRSYVDPSIAAKCLFAPSGLALWQTRVVASVGVTLGGSGTSGFQAACTQAAGLVGAAGGASMSAHGTGSAASLLLGASGTTALHLTGASAATLTLVGGSGDQLRGTGAGGASVVFGAVALVSQAALPIHSAASLVVGAG